MKKIVYINFSPRKYESEQILQLNGVSFSEVDRTKYLGIILDKNLSFSHHISSICNKLSENAEIFYRMPLSSAAYILKQVYHAKIAPYLYYWKIIWEETANIHVDKVFRLQKRSIGVVSNAGFLEHTQPLFIKENIMNIYKIYERICCTYVFENRDQYEIASNFYNARNISSLQIKSEGVTLSKKSIYHNAPSFLSYLPPDYSSLQRLNEFKVELKINLVHLRR